MALKVFQEQIRDSVVSICDLASALIAHKNLVECFWAVNLT